MRERLLAMQQRQEISENEEEYAATFRPLWARGIFSQDELKAIIG